MPLVKAEPRDGIVYFTDGVPVSEQTYTYTNPQKEFTLHNTGKRRIIWSVGTHDHIIVNPGETSTRQVEASSFKIRAEYGYQSFTMSSLQIPKAESDIPVRVDTIESALGKKADKSEIVKTVNNIAPDNNGNVAISVGTAEADYIRAKDFTTGASDNAKIQAAINHAAASNKKTVMLDEKDYVITGPILVKSGVELRFGYRTHFYVYGGNFKVIELEKDASLINPVITVDDTNFSGTILYLDGKHKYYNSWFKTRIVNPRFVNWSESHKGTGILLYSGGPGHEISFINFESAKIVGFNTGVKLQAVKPASGIAWVNANRFTNLTIEDCKTLIDIDSALIGTAPTCEASGNLFTGCQLQLSTLTTTAIKCSSQVNVFEGVTWDDPLVPASVKLFRFTAQSADNDMSRMYIYTSSRIEDLGTRNKTRFSS
jgi:hypothetical protein